MGIEIKDLCFSYSGRPVLRDIRFSVEKGEFLSILGPNGVGKSTLFRCILGLLPDYTGQILIDGRDRRTMDVRETAGHIACIPQSSHPAFHYSVFDMVLMGRTKSLSFFRSPSGEDRQRCMQALDRVGIAQLSGRCFHRLSGGEQQLVLIARALAQDAPCLMLDEPTANLDLGNQLRVLEQVRSLAREGYTVIQTTHSPEQSYLFSDRILALHQGQVLQWGTPREVLTPKTMQTLYGTRVDVVSLYEDRARVCLPVLISTEDIS